METPRYAIVGHPNEGKSSVVATLAEDDEVRVSDLPGETLRCRAVPLRIGGKDCIYFIDTPGFQNPRKVQAAFEAAVAEGRNPVAAFLEDSAGNSGMEHDRELLRPLAEGVGVIYVADGSRPPGAVDRAEIEVLRLSGLPRIAVLNRKRAAAEWGASWLELCHRAFNATREFNAHAAPFEARLRFVENLRVIDSANEEALEAVIRRMRTDRAERMEALVTGLMRWVGDALHHRHELNFRPGTSREEAEAKARRAFWGELDRKEKRIWKEFRTILKHHRVAFELANDRLLAEDIGSEQTWQVFGLTRKQLTVAASIMGAGVGVAVDTALAGLTFGIFTAVGAVAGATSVQFFGNQLPKVEVAGFRMGSERVTAGPSKSPQFPFVIVDRSALYLRILLARTHARRDPVDVGPDSKEVKLGLVSGLPDEERKQLARWFKAIRSDPQAATGGKEAAAAAVVIRKLLG